jgi:hypothetical protein
VSLERVVEHHLAGVNPEATEVSCLLVSAGKDQRRVASPVHVPAKRRGLDSLPSLDRETSERGGHFLNWRDLVFGSLALGGVLESFVHHDEAYATGEE